jgi:DNA-binding transcriptional ArsR family regulator
MAKNSPSDEVLVEQAERRSNILAFLVQNEGEHSVAEIAGAINLRPNVVGLTLKSLADSGLVSPPRRESGQNYYQNGEAPTPKRAYTKKSKPSAAKDVELVVGGTLIIVGRNAETGRLRITLEDLV